MSDPNDVTNNPVAAPVWKRPGWIAAIVSLISAFLTIPEIAGNYLNNYQKAEALKITNKGEEQKQSLEIFNKALAQKGPERVFVLRFLAATLKDKTAKEWATLEVKRLDDFADMKKGTRKNAKRFRGQKQRAANRSQ